MKKAAIALIAMLIAVGSSAVAQEPMTLTPDQMDGITAGLSHELPICLGCEPTIYPIPYPLPYPLPHPKPYPKPLPDPGPRPFPKPWPIDPYPLPPYLM